MRYFVLAAMLAAAPAFADECGSGSGQVFALLDWSAEPNSVADREMVVLTYTYRNNSNRDIRMTEGTLVFDDVLDEWIVSVSLPRDLVVRANAEIEESGQYFATTFNIDRLLTLNPEDVVTRICTQAVVYGDGTIERFD